VSDKLLQTLFHYSEYPQAIMDRHGRLIHLTNVFRHMLVATLEHQESPILEPESFDGLFEFVIASNQPTSGIISPSFFKDPTPVFLRLVPLGADDHGHSAYGIYLQESSGVVGRANPMTDPTTGLLNRHSLKDIADRELARAGRLKTPLALLFIMLRNFKQINQYHGHHMGDLLLENTGIRCREVVRQSDYVFRWEGTNLVVLLPSLASKLDVAVVAEKLYDAATLPYRLKDLDIAPGCHIGVALFPEDGNTYDELLNAANSAVIAAEQQGENFLIYDNQIHEQAIQRLLMKTGIQRGFNNDEFTLFFQPIVDSKGVPRGAEALIRWNHPVQGLLGPSVFLPIAEENHLITLIDKVALFTACRTIQDWNVGPDFFLTLNMSARTLAEGSLPNLIKQTLESNHLKTFPSIHFELTESQFLHNLPSVKKVAKELEALGVEIWIDDFGTGQSSLSYLKSLPVTTVKIDKEFVLELLVHPEELDYLKSIIETIRSRKKQVVIEGVSTKDHYELLNGVTADYLQGFYFEKPMSAEQFTKYLEDHLSQDL
jgi:diguanylate cyclase (GGDEF)-like protein